MSVPVKKLNAQFPVTQGDMPAEQLLEVIAFLVLAIQDLQARVDALEP